MADQAGQATIDRAGSAAIEREVGVASGEGV